jgi:hypothetical protein
LLTDFWRDVISLVGFGLTAAGLVYAILQIRKTKSAAEAAEEAAKKAVIESQRNFQRYAAGNAHRYVHEAKGHVERQEWEKAATRLNDLADQVGQLAHMDDEWRQMADALRMWAEDCTRHARGAKSRFAKNKWAAFYLSLQAKIDLYYGPFAPTREEVPDESRGQIP